MTDFIPTDSILSFCTALFATYLQKICHIIAQGNKIYFCAYNTPDPIVTKILQYTEVELSQQGSLNYIYD